MNHFDGLYTFHVLPCDSTECANEQDDLMYSGNIMLGYTAIVPSCGMFGLSEMDGDVSESLARQFGAV